MEFEFPIDGKLNIREGTLFEQRKTTSNAGFGELPSAA